MLLSYDIISSRSCSIAYKCVLNCFTVQEL